MDYIESAKARFNARWSSRPGPLDTPCWIWNGGLTTQGYAEFWFHLPAHKQETRGHRASWIIHRGTIPGRQCVLHKCDVRACVNPEHLFLGTHLDNAHDCLRKGRGLGRPGHETFRTKYCHTSSVGDDHHWAKLNSSKVRMIRSLRGKVAQVVLAKRYGVAQSVISDAQRGKTWVEV